jgi:hypothetical protein
MKAEMSHAGSEHEFLTYPLTWFYFKLELFNNRFYIEAGGLMLPAFSRVAPAPLKVAC